MASELVFTPCPQKNPPLFLQQFLLPLSFFSLVWSTLQQDDLFPHSCNISLSLCACLHPLCWGLTLERPKPISSSHLLNSLYSSFLQILQSLLFSISQNSMLSCTIHPTSPNSSSDQSQPIFALMLGGLISLLRRPHYTQRVPSK